MVRWCRLAVRGLFANSEKARFSRLTPRERQVLRLIAQGYTNRGIAKELLITVKIVEKHRASLIAKLNVNAVAQLTQIAIKHGLLKIEPPIGDA